MNTNVEVSLEDDIETADEYEKFMISRAAPDYNSVDSLLILSMCALPWLLSARSDGLLLFF